MEQMEIQKRLSHLKGMIGNTPMVRIDYRYKGKRRTIYSKVEYFSLTGSTKDRMAFHIINENYRTGELRPGMQIMEATSGNTGIAFSALGRAMGHRVTIFMPDWMSSERINLIKSFGADIRLVSKEEGGFLGSIAMTKEGKNENPDNIFLPCQFDSHYNRDAHFQTTGPEIMNQVMKSGEKTVDAFVAGVGTGGTVMGVGAYLKTINPGVKIYPLEPENSPTMTTGYKVGKHRIQGISDEFIPSIVKLDELDQIIQVDDGDSIIMAQKLATTLGLGVGISSGGNFLGAVKIQNMIGGDKVVATVFADDNKKYLSTDYAKAEPVKDGFLSSDIELEQLTVIN